LDRPEAVPVAGTEGADGPVFSPDGKWLAFWAAGALRKVPAAGGTAVKICDASQPYGIEWTDDDHIVYAQLSGIWRVPAAGATPEQITKAMPGSGEARHLLPRVLPGGKALMYTVQPSANGWEDTRIVVQPLPGGERRTLVERAADARYVPTGHLVYMRLGTLVGSPFDAERLASSGGE